MSGIDLPKPFLISACLLGAPCRYDGRRLDEILSLKELEGIAWLPVCPESLGGLPIPRPPAEISGGDGEDVLNGNARVIDRGGTDRTEAFLAGAHKTLELALSLGATGAILKARSPSCGKGRIYDGGFTGNLRAGNGVAAALLLRNGIPVWTEEEWLERTDKP